MRVVVVYAVLCSVFFGPMAAQSKAAPSKTRTEKLVAAAKPSVEAALSAPMEALTAKAIKSPTALDHVALGLAMFAGRHQSEDGQETVYAQSSNLLKRGFCRYRMIIWRQIRMSIFRPSIGLGS